MSVALFRSLWFVGVLFLCGQTYAGPSPNLENSEHRFEVTEMHGQKAPSLALTEWQNTKPLTLNDLKGKVVVLDFWATHCAECLASVPKLNSLAAKYADQGVVFIGVCLADGGERMAAMVKRHKMSYPIALDKTGRTSKAFMADSYPDYYVIDRKGNLRWGDIENSHVEKAIGILLSETE